MFESAVFSERFVEAVGWVESLVATAKRMGATHPDAKEDPDAWGAMVTEAEWVAGLMRRLVEATRPAEVEASEVPSGDDIPL